MNSEEMQHIVIRRLNSGHIRMSNYNTIKNINKDKTSNFTSKLICINRKGI